MKLSPRLKKSIRIAAPRAARPPADYCHPTRCRLGAGAVRNARTARRISRRIARRRARSRARDVARRAGSRSESRQRRPPANPTTEAPVKPTPPANPTPKLQPTETPVGDRSDRRPASDADRQANTTAQPHASAPFTPPANCIVAHAATPAQLCPIGGGIQYYFIGPGSSQPGPWIQSLQRSGHAPFWCRLALQRHQSLYRQVGADPLHACRPEDSGQHLLPR